MKKFFAFGITFALYCCAVNSMAFNLRTAFSAPQTGTNCQSVAPVSNDPNTKDPEVMTAWCNAYMNDAIQQCKLGCNQTGTACAPFANTPSICAGIGNYSSSAIQRECKSDAAQHLLPTGVTETDCINEFAIFKANCYSSTPKRVCTGL